MKIFDRLYCFLLFVLIFLLKVQVSTNDDIFVYFNYARNFAEGRFFAIDYRNIPSEGFSSMLYMILLVPFEYFKVSPMLAGVILNICALLGIVQFSTKILQRLFDKNENYVIYFSWLSILVLFHFDLIGIAGWAFETVFSGFFFCAFFYYIIKFDKTKTRYGTYFISLIYFLGILTRPENILLFFPFYCYYIIRLYPFYKSIFSSTITLFFLIASFFVFKFFIFNDVFPTGYYRKFVNKNTEIASGWNYVYEWILSKPIVEYVPNYMLLLFQLVVFILFYFKSRHKSIKIYIIYFVILISIVFNVVFCLKTTPMIGLYNRYFVVSNVSIVFLTVWAIFLLSSIQKFAFPTLFKFKYFILPLVLIAVIYKNGLSKSKADFLIVNKLKKQFENHPYLRFGYFLQNKIPMHQTFVISMVDGGALPYAANCNTVDPAGLTEPFIAKLAAYDGIDKIELYSKYIIKNNVDMFCIITGNAVDSSSIVEGCFPGQNVPLRPNEMVEFYDFLSLNNYVYVSSIKANNLEGLPYDIHITLKKDAKLFEIAKKEIRTYCRKFGYRKIDDLTIQCENAKAVFKLEK